MHITIEALEAMTDEERLSCLVPTEALFSDLEKLVLPAFYERLADNGQPIHLKKLYRGKYDESRYTPGQRMTICGLILICGLRKQSCGRTPALQVNFYRKPFRWI